MSLEGNQGNGTKVVRREIDWKRQKISIIFRGDPASFLCRRTSAQGEECRVSELRCQKVDGSWLGQLQGKRERDSTSAKSKTIQSLFLCVVCRTKPNSPSTKPMTDER